MTTTPDNHQTPEQAYDRWRNHRINRELAGAIGDYAAADGHAEHELAAAVSFVRACFPPQSSTGREWERECKVLPSGDYPGMFFVTNNDFYDMKFLHPDGQWRCGMSGPESRFPTQAAARAALAQAPDPRTTQAIPASDKMKMCPNPKCGRTQHDCDSSCWCREDEPVSAPPPASEAERPKCPECRDRGRVDVEDGRGNVVMDAACPRGCSAPPPSTGDILDRAMAWVEEKYPMRGHATGELLRECIAEISTLRHAAREGFTYPDSAVEALLDMANVLRCGTTDPGNLSHNWGIHSRVGEDLAGRIRGVIRTASALRSARVPLPQQQEDDRSWEKECDIGTNGVVSYPPITSSTGSVYLVPDGRWLTYDQWLLLTPPSDRFPSESAAREALAKAPRPPT